MKKGMVFLLICFMLVFAAACGETETSQNAQTGTSGEAAQASAETEASQGENSNAQRQHPGGRRRTDRKYRNGGAYDSGRDRRGFPD